MSATDLLHDALRAGDLDGVRAAIAAGADINGAMEADFAGYCGITPLIWAARDLGGEFVRVLLEAGADARAKTSIFEHTALHLACRRGDLESAKRLLDAGCDPSEPSDDEGWTPLMEGCHSASLPLVELLLKRKADVHTIDHNGENALWHAAVFGPPAMVSTLLDAGANPYLTREMEPFGPVHAAVYRGRVETLRVFLDRGISPNYAAEGERLLNAASEACTNGIEIVQLLIDRGADPNQRPPSHYHAPLAEAADRGRDDIVEELLRCGADPSFRDANGDTALDIAWRRFDRPIFPSVWPGLRATVEADVQAVEPDHDLEDLDGKLDALQEQIERMSPPKPTAENYERIILLLEAATAE